MASEIKQTKLGFSAPAKQGGGIEEHLGSASDVLGVARQITMFYEMMQRDGWKAIVAYSGPVSAGLTVFGTFCGGLMSLSATLAVIRALKKIKRALDQGDVETAKILLCTHLPGMLSYAVLGYAFTAQKVASLANAAFLSAALGPVITMASGILSAFQLISAVYGLHEAEMFSDRLEAALQEGGQEKFVQELTDIVQELDSARRENEEFSRTLASRQYTIDLAVDQLIHESSTAEIKDLGAAARLERQTSADCVKMIQEGIASPTEIFAALQKANHAKKVTNTLLLAISVLGLASLVITSTILTGGGACLLFMIGSILWLSLDSQELNKQITDWFWNHKTGEDKKTDLEFALQTIGLFISAPLWAIPALFYLEGSKMLSSSGNPTPPQIEEPSEQVV